MLPSFRRSLPAGALLAPVLCLGLPAPVAAAEPAGAVTVHRSVMNDGSTVIGDRPEPGAVRTDVLTRVPAPDAAASERAREEREAWRRRADAFAQRQLQRQMTEAAASEAVRRERATVAASLFADAWPPLVLARPRPLLDYTGERPFPFYGSTPGAAAGRAGPPGAAVIGAPGAAAGQPAGFIGSGFGSAR